MAERIKDICYEIADPIISKLGYELVEVEYQKEQNGMNLIFYIDKEEGISIDDCEIVTKALDDVLDEANPTNDKPYTLVVSSLGVDRPIKTERDFKKNLGNEIEIKFYAMHKELKVKVIEGILKDFDENFVTISNSKKGEIKIDRSLIANILPVIKF